MASVNAPVNKFIPSIKEWYWIPHPTKVWVTVLVKRVVGDVCWVTTSDSMTEFELSLTDCPFLCLNPRVVGDMASLMHLHEAGILHNLCERANPQNQHPYTYVSTVLIALNPLRPVPMPSMEDYKDIPMGAAPPNPYGIAEMAYKSLTLVRNKKIRNQSIVISGESGAGKTETAKIVLRYLCWRATTGRNEGEELWCGRHERKDAGGVSLDKKLLDTNPILEAFGNAKTFRNANSSRFGKLLKLNFNSDLNFGLVSASIDTYLLEKSRVALFPVGERNYHVFYQMLRGAGPLERKHWLLRDINQYAYLNHGQSKDIEDVDDRADFSKLTSGLLSVGINVAQQDVIFRVLSAILSLGNISFDSAEGPSGEMAEVEDPKVIVRVAELLGVRSQLLESVLTSRSLDMASTGGRTSSYRIPFDVKQAYYARDAVAKSIYDTVFHWIVHQVRSSLQSEGQPSSTNYIGVLDIFGFESFEKNGLEQLLINFANESLQLIFNKSVLDAEQEMYVEEGFMVQPIEYINNDGCVNLIAMGRDAILTSLDAVCKGPEPNEEKFNTLIHKTHAKNSHFLKPEMKNMRLTFKIKHYAKAVHYTVGTFIPKNMDTCPAELSGLMSSSVHSVRCSLFAFDVDMTDEDREAMRVTPQDETRKRTPLVPQSRKQSNTVGKKFKIQMMALSDLLSSTNCTFIRCIKPNNTMTPGLFEHRFVMDQVRSLGVVQTCEVLRQGLPARVQFAEIEAIYRSYFKGIDATLTSALSGKLFTEAVLWAMKISKSSYKLGKSRVFFNVDSLNDMNRVLNSYTDALELEVIVKRVVRFIHLKRWRRVFAAGFAFSVGLKLLETTRQRIRSSIMIQRAWKAYALSTLRTKRMRARRRWKVAIYFTVGCQHFLANYRLICEAREMRRKAEAAAEKMLQESRAAELKQQQLIDEMAQRKGVDTQIATKSCAKKFRSTLNLGQRNSSIFNQQDVSENEAIFGENKDLEEALMEQQVNQSKSEMKKLAAASSLATVSVTLFRWTKIKKFRGFEKWFLFYKSGEQMTKSKEVNESELIGLNSTRLDPENDVVDNLILADGSYLCFECKDREAKVWCHDCNQPYCLVCSQFVHNSCTIMRYHRPMSIDNRPSLDNIKLLSTPMEPLSSFVAAGTMKAMVNALLFSESNIQNDNSSVSKMLYFSNASSEHNLEGIGNQASVLLDRVYEDRAIEVLEEEPRDSQQIMFSGSGGLVHGDEDAQHCAIRSCDTPASKGISIRFCAAHYDEFRSATRRISNGGENEKTCDEDTDTLQQQVALLKKQLIDSGQQPVEFVELSVARALMQAAVERLMSGEEDAEAEIEKWDKAIRLNPEYQAEMIEKARKWEEDERPANLECLRQMRRIVPVDVRQISAATMEAQGLPKKVAQRIWSKKILWFVCTHPDDIGKIHVADLRTKYSYVGMDIVEMRAVYAALPEAFENDGDGKKKEWRDAFRQKLEEFTVKEMNSRLTNPEKRNFAYKGSDGLSLYDPDLPIARAELLKSDAFGPTDIASVAELAGVGGVKNKQNMMNNSSDRVSSSYSHTESSGDVECDLDGHVDGRPTDRGSQVKSRLIAESALAADEQKRAEARGSLITITSNPLVNPKDLAALRRPEEKAVQENDSEERDTSSSALDGGMLSIQQTIMKMEMAKKLKSKNDRSKADDIKEEESKKHFSEQFIAKGVRPSGGGKPFGGGGRGRGGRGVRPHGGHTGSHCSRDSAMEDTMYSDRWSSESASSMNEDDIGTEKELHTAAVLALSRESDVRDSDTTQSEVLSNAEKTSVDEPTGTTEVAKDNDEVNPDDVKSDVEAKLITQEPDIEKSNSEESPIHTELESHTEKSPPSIVSNESSITPPPPPPPPPPPHRSSETALKGDEEPHSHELPMKESESTPISTSLVTSPTSFTSDTVDDKVLLSETLVDQHADISRHDDDDGFSNTIIMKKKKEIPKKKGLWGMIKKK
mmetsp:Transcript_10617/g.19713  ORF Transcript_10617/g.19713 Transcript_10617/m.19713 type:complete len:1963 (-) Transcript_10617:129-6017(-)